MNRFLWVAHGDLRKLKLAALCQFTLVGPPIIYYGTEVGLSQHNDVMQHGRAIHEETRLPMIWGEEQDRDLFTFYKDLIALRKNHPALRRGTRRTIFSNDQMLAYRRRAGEESLVTVLNISEQNANMELDITESTLFFVTGPDIEIRLEGGRKRLVLPAYGGVVLY